MGESLYIYLHAVNTTVINGFTNPNYANTQQHPAGMHPVNHTAHTEHRVVFKIETQQRLVTLITSLGTNTERTKYAFSLSFYTHKHTFLHTAACSHIPY